MFSLRPRRIAPGADPADSLPVPGARTLFARALALRCPACGGRPILLRWLSIAPSCPECGFRLDRGEPGYWIGSYTINLFLTEAVFALAFVGGMLLFWPAVPWTPLGIGCSVLAIVTPIALFPFTKLLYLAIDLCFRPLEPTDLETPRERRLRPASPRSR